MQDPQEQLADLRRQIARINRKYANPRPSLPKPPSVISGYRPAEYHVQDWLPGEEVRTPYGVHFETERLWERHRRHGSIDVSTLLELPDDFLTAISGNSIPCCPPERWAFLDTETTGLAGGAGCYAFLIGVGRITGKGFHLRQFFMRQPAEEASLLHRLSQYLGEFDTLITYNGRTYDEPLLETRYRMAQVRSPFDRPAHLDLLAGARRLWKLRFESCRLVQLEREILGFIREGDLPGEMIPYVYFEYLRSQEAWRVAPLLHHNAVDIVTLACLTAVVPWAYRDPFKAPLRHGAEMVGLGRWLMAGGQEEKALVLFRRAVEKSLRDDLLFRTLWDIGRLEKKLGRHDAAFAVFSELGSCRNQWRQPALEQVARHYERQERNYAMALECTLTALALGSSDGLLRRRERLERRLQAKAQAVARSNADFCKAASKSLRPASNSL